MLLSPPMRRYIEGEREDRANMTKVRMMLWVLAVLLLVGFVAAGCGSASDQTKHQAKKKVEAEGQAKKRLAARGQQEEQRLLGKRPTAARPEEVADVRGEALIVGAYGSECAAPAEPR